MGRPIKLTSTSESIDYFRICDPQGVCRIARGIEEAQRIMKETSGLTATKPPGSKAA